MVHHAGFTVQEDDTYEFVSGHQTTRWIEPSSATDRHTELVQQCSSPGDETQQINWLCQTLEQPLQSEQAQRTLLNMIELCQLQTGFALLIQLVDIDALLQSTFATHAQRAAQKGLRFELSVARIDRHFQGDQLLLHRAIEHIIDNALHFTLPGGVVQIRAEQADRYIFIDIADTGIGIEAHAIPHIFKRFYRSSRARQYRTVGNGLGLAISQLIIEAHGGTIDVESEVDHGSTFTISLPLAA